MSGIPIDFPSQFAPGVALAFAGPDSFARLVSSIDRLPVAIAGAPAADPISGTVDASSLIGPFPVAAGRIVSLTLDGSWNGTVTVNRSVDGGLTRAPLTLAGAPWAVFTANCCEPVWEETEDGATFFLDVSLVSGSLTYRMAQ